jgi:hypothetical protein
MGSWGHYEGTGAWPVCGESGAELAKHLERLHSGAYDELCKLSKSPVNEKS